MPFIQRFFTDLRTPLYRNAIHLLMNSILAGGIGLFFWIVVARYYTPYEVGLAAATISVMVLIGMLSRLGFEDGLVRFLPSSGRNSRAMINSCLTISGLASILISLIFLIGLDFWSPALLFIREDWLFLLSFILFSTGFALYPLVNQVFVARRNAKFVLGGTSITGLKVVLAIAFTPLFGAFGILASWSLAMLIALIVGTLLFIPMVNPGYKPIPTVRKEVVTDIFHFSAGNYVAIVFTAMPITLLPLLIANTLETENTAYYYIAYTVAGLLFAAINAMCSSLFAEGSNLERSLRKDVRKALKFLFAILAPAIIVILLFGDHLLLLFGSKYSSEGLVLLQLFSLSSIFLALNGVFLATRRVMKRLKPIIVIAAFNALATLGMGYALLISMGLVGIAVAWITTNGIVTVGIGVHLLLMRRIEKTTPNSDGQKRD